MTKKEEFRQLAEDVSRCHICEQLLTLPHSENSERLVNDDHGLNTDHPYVNRWNLWHGNLDADIMVIGQDYGTCDDGDLEVTTFDPTGKRLTELLTESFGWDSLNQGSLFITNMANCYRKQRTSGGMHPAWLPLCANKFMSRLIRMIQPKIIIVLGRVAFEALHCMEDLPITCLNPKSGKAKDSFSEMIQHHYQIELDGKKIAVFPVFHPGSNSRMNRTENQQLKDWKRIKTYYDLVK